MESDGVTACLVWVPRGAAKEEPTKVELSEEDLQRLVKETEENLQNASLNDATEEELQDDDDGDNADDDDDDGDDAEEDEEGDDTTMDEDTEGKGEGEGATMDEAEDNQEDAAVIKEFGLDTYDEEEDVPVTGAGLANIKGLTYYASNKEDPHITLKKDEDEDDVKIQGSDNLLVLGRIEEHLARVEVHIFNEDEDSFFPHTDFLLSSFPVCMEWIGYDPRNEDSQRGNILALGTMEPQIELWDLDMVEAAEPLLTLGKPTRTKKGKKKFPGHRDAVLGLAWNRGQRSLLASASADTTVRLWDLNAVECMRAYTHHSNKVELVKWNQQEVAVLATGAHGGEVAVFDTRTPEAVATWDLGADVECLEWCPWDPSTFMAGTADGVVYKCSARQPGKPMFTLSAHDAPVSCLSLSSQVEGLMATGSPDETVKVWDVSGNPSMVLSKNYDLGPVFTIGFCPDSGYQLACGGHHGGAKLIHLVESGPVLRRFKDRNAELTTRAEELAKAVSERRATEPTGPSDDEEDEDELDLLEAPVARNPRVRRVRRRK